MTRVPWLGTWLRRPGNDEPPPGGVSPKVEPQSNLLDLYNAAALIGKALPVGGRIDIDGIYCKMLVRNPKQPRAKAAPKKAKR